MRKPWMNKLQSYRFTRCGSMTQETAKAWNDHSDRLGPSEFSYARALGISWEEASKRISRQEAVYLLHRADELLEEAQEKLKL